MVRGTEKHLSEYRWNCWVMVFFSKGWRFFFGFDISLWTNSQVTFITSSLPLKRNTLGPSGLETQTANVQVKAAKAQGSTNILLGPIWCVSKNVKETQKWLESGEISLGLILLVCILYYIILYYIILYYIILYYIILYYIILYILCLIWFYVIPYVPEIDIFILCEWLLIINSCLLFIMNQLFVL